MRGPSVTDIEDKRGKRRNTTLAKVMRWLKNHNRKAKKGKK